MKAEDLARTIDHTLLRPDCSPNGVRTLCEEAMEHGFAAVCVLPTFVGLASTSLDGSGVGVCSVLSFPYGADVPSVKAAAARHAIAEGATEVDMVLNISAVLAHDFDVVRRDIETVVGATRTAAGGAGAIVKVIIETGFLTDDEKRQATRIVEEAGADFVKTSTGTGPGGATVHDVALLSETVERRIGVKASGGIRSLSALLELLRAGATRIGTSSGVAILEELEQDANLTD